MECQNTAKKLKINKNKRIGTIVVVVEGEEDEFKLLKHIFVNILDYNYISMKRNKTLQHEFINEQNNNTVIVANTKSSSIKSIVDDDEYKDKLFKLLKMEYNKNLKNTSIYIIWDRDKAKDENGIIKYYIDAIEKFYSPLDNDIDMNGVLLLSYPCHESYNLSNFKKRFWKKNYKTSIECKKEFSESLYTINKINEKSLLLAVENMHHSFIDNKIREYDTTNIRELNKKIFDNEEKFFNDNGMFKAISLISLMLIDLGIIEEKND